MILALTLALAADAEPRMPWREVATGPTVAETISMSLVERRDIEPQFLDDGRITPGGVSVKSLGMATSGVDEVDYLGERVRRIRTTAAATRRGRAQRVQVTWWVTPQGAIRRQFVDERTPAGRRTANVLYGETIEVQLSEGGRGRVYDAVPPDRAAVDRLFMPMLEGETVVRTQKSFVVLEPFCGTFLPGTAHRDGQFRFGHGAKAIWGTVVRVKIGEQEARVFVRSDGVLAQTTYGWESLEGAAP
jgi:hypothetical protein